MEKRNIIVLVVIAIVITGSIFVLESKKSNPGAFGSGQAVAVDLGTSASKEEKAKEYETAKEIVNPAGFINTDSITIQELIGRKVILVDFWTYSCINCQRTLPYLTSWYEKYKDQGLEIVGIHTPEFEFEKEYENVLRAVEKYNIKYPVVLDNDYSTWRNYANRYWPRKYIIDIDGFIVYDHIGEGGYEETEKVIQQLLAERKKVLGESGEIATDMAKPQGAEEVDTSQPRSPEIYFGSLRNQYLGNGFIGRDGVQNFKAPSGVRADVLYLVGSWDIQGEYAQNQEAEARVVFPYRGQKVFMVASAESDVVLEILVDGQPVGDRAGGDVKDGQVIVNDDQLYRLIEDNQWGQHTLEIIIKGSGLKAYTFTFG